MISPIYAKVTKVRNTIIEMMNFIAEGLQDKAMRSNGNFDMMRGFTA